MLGLQALIGEMPLDEADNAKSFLQLMVGENGKKLSGGQAKRLGMVRALMSGAQVLLWDDPFSAIDVVMEKGIVEKLRQWPALREKCVLLTTHRVTSVRTADWTIMIDKEQGLVEQGPPAELLRPGRRVHEYFQQQMV